MNDVRTRIVGVLSRTLKIDSDSIVDSMAVGDVPAWDSLGHVTLLQALEEEFGLTLEIDDALSIESVRDMVDVLGRLTNGSTPQ